MEACHYNEAKVHHSRHICLLGFVGFKNRAAREIGTQFARAIKLFRTTLNNDCIDCFHDPIMQYVLGGSLHKNNAIYLLLGLYHASVN